MAAAQQQQADAKSDNMAEPPRLSKWPEVMVVVPGISASVIHYVMKELQDAGRLTLQAVQKASLLGIEGSKRKQSFGRDSKTAVPAFARTAGHVLRMVMLEACGVDPMYWPTGGESSYKNEEKLKFEQIHGPKYVLAESYEEAREYWSEFDKLYPHYFLERFLEEKTGSLNGIMYIFKNYMQEVIELSMNVCAVHNGGTRIKCCAGATVVHRTIDLYGASGQWMDALELLVRGTEQPMANHFNTLLDIDSTTLSLQELDIALSALYHSLPTNTAEIKTLESEKKTDSAANSHDPLSAQSKVADQGQIRMTTNNNCAEVGRAISPVRGNKDAELSTADVKLAERDDPVDEDCSAEESALSLED